LKYDHGIENYGNRRAVKNQNKLPGFIFTNVRLPVIAKDPPNLNPSSKLKFQ